MHHVSIRTADIHRAIAFYGELGFVVQERFTTGYTLACWLKSADARLELIEIPQPAPAPDCFYNEHYVGYYHLSFDLTKKTTDLSSWLQGFIERVATPPKILLPPEQQVICDLVYEVAFISDPDGLPLEFIRELGPVGGGVVDHA
ncbi:MAG: VOC family protein [Cyanobacteria bacterium P01_H01_bin.15]